MIRAAAYLSPILLVAMLAVTTAAADTTSVTVRAGSIQTVLGPCDIWLPPGYSTADAGYVAGAISDLSLVLTDRLGPTTERAFEVVLVDNRQQFEFWTGRAAPEWIHALALNSPPRLVLLVAAQLTAADQKNLERTLLHELTHAYLHRLQAPDNRRNLPSWFHEGIAVQMSGGMERGMQQTVLYARWLGQLQPLGSLTTIRHETAQSSELAYGQSALAVELIVEDHGEAGLRELLNDLRGGAPFELVFEESLGVPWLQFVDRYQIWLRRRYNLLLALSDPNILFMLLPLLLVAAYLVTQARGRRRKAEWERMEKAADDLNNLKSIDTFID
ncbi:MAG: hypothetical protein IID15_02210 [Candidatus Marinimicrobia bacterium]|nr:hypothetical protein [Candidatus Neomarinimicrobiota bacterium]